MKTYDEFLEWYADTSHPLENTSWNSHILRQISCANMHTGLFGCDIAFDMTDQTWHCANRKECPKEKPVTSWHGVPLPTSDTLDRMWEKGWATDE